MVKSKATARLCCISWSGLSLSLSLSLSLHPLADLALLRLVLSCPSLADTIHSEGFPGSCWGWTPAALHTASHLVLIAFYYHHITHKENEAHEE